MKVLRTGAAALLTLAIATGALAQSLGEVARREEERRKTIAAPGKVYTNDSLRSEPAPVPPPPAAAAAGAAPVVVPPSASEPQSQTGNAGNKTLPPANGPQPNATGPQKDEATWRRRMDEARTALSRAQTFHDALQNQINSLSADFVNRDDPAQRAKIAADRQKALTELDRLKQEILQDQKAITGIQEEARRAGVPAGWVR